jgi:glutamate formiminotransferase/formiminotetrahydrofolate cyclodeaminase
MNRIALTGVTTVTDHIRPRKAATLTRLIECVPNFSEGNDLELIGQITSQIETVEGVRLLDVDPGKATNRTVVTFAGPPEEVIEAAVRSIAKATELIDMTRHKGEHPRFGSTDVCPLVPITGVTMEETAEYARILARRLGEEIGLAVYCYENAALDASRRNLADVRAGEYEGLETKLADPGWAPDFGPAEFNPRAGAVAVGARDFLIAYNVNLNTTSSRWANAVAFDVREKGRVKRSGDAVTGAIVKDSEGNVEWIPGSLKNVKAIGWFIEEYGVAQVSMNLTNTAVTPIHVAFDECDKKARERGIRVTGSEVVGLVPLEAMLDAGRFFLRKQRRSTGVSDAELIKIAVKSMGLDELGEFDPKKKIIEYALSAGSATRLVDLDITAFVDVTASESPAPGGGSVAAAIGAFGAALGTMVANLSAHRRGWDERWEEFSDCAEKGKAVAQQLMGLIDEDTNAFNGILSAFRLPNDSQEDQQVRAAAIESATLRAIEVPLQVMKASNDALETIREMAEIGQESSASDAGVGALCARAAVRGAHLNVVTNKRSSDREELRREDLRGILG